MCDAKDTAINATSIEHVLIVNVYIEASFHNQPCYSSYRTAVHKSLASSSPHSLDTLGDADVVRFKLVKADSSCQGGYPKSPHQ